MNIRIKRVYEPPADSDGLRVLVDRLWPRGLSKDNARLDSWSKEIAPSAALRKWFDHDPRKWDEFRQRYFGELDAQPQRVAELVARVGGDHVTFLYATKESRYNNAGALREYLLARQSPL